MNPSKPIKIRPPYLIAAGLVLSLLPNLFAGNLVVAGIGIFGSFLLLVGIINGIAGLIKKKKVGSNGEDKGGN